MLKWLIAVFAFWTEKMYFFQDDRKTYPNPIFPFFSYFAVKNQGFFFQLFSAFGLSIISLDNKQWKGRGHPPLFKECKKNNDALSPLPRVLSVKSLALIRPD